MTVARIAELTDGELVDVDQPDAVIEGPVVVDSRKAEPGALFAALRGEHADGHDFARAAAAAGARAVLAARPCGVPAVVVDDVTEALARLASGLHAHLPATAVVGVTGSSGKTGTKDLLAQVLARRGPTIAAAESYNNEVGHPLTVLRAEEGTRHLVLELSARGPGHIAYLAGVAPPHIGVVLNVGTAHLGEFGSRAAVARAKGELVEALPADGLAVLNADDPLVAGMAARTRARVVTYGWSSEAEVRAERVRLDGSGRPRFTLVTPEDSVPTALGLYGEHNVGNALAVAAVGRELGMAIPDVAAALEAACTVSRWRMEVRERSDGVTVVNDAYNANPESVRAALRALTAIAHDRRSWAVLGTMAELGPSAAEEHERIGSLLGPMGVDRLVTVGEGAEPIGEGARRCGESGELARQAVHVPDAAAAADLLRGRLQPGDVVLVKGSRVAGLERVAAELLGEVAG